MRGEAVMSVKRTCKPPPWQEHNKGATKKNGKEGGGNQYE
jgi:hypothetical protein